MVLLPWSRGGGSQGRSSYVFTADKWLPNNSIELFGVAQFNKTYTNIKRRQSTPEIQDGGCQSGNSLMSAKMEDTKAPI